MTSRSGGVKNVSRGIVLSPARDSIVIVDSNATSAGAVSDGWTMWQPPLPKIAWYLFSPSAAKHSVPPFFRQ